MAYPGFDPAEIAVDSVSGEPAVPFDRLNEKWLRYRFANPREWQPEILEEKQISIGRNKWIPAAVLVPILVRGNGDLSLMLTKRAAHLHDHAGQVSFPGGRVDLSDSSRIETALREMEEEVGIPRENIEILGTLPEYRTGSGYSVTPVVALVRLPFTIRTDPMEVAEVFEIPFAHVMDGANHQQRTGDFPKIGKRTFYSIPYENYMVWGATAGILRNLFHYLRA